MVRRGTGARRFVANPPLLLGEAADLANREVLPDYMRLENAGGVQGDRDSLCAYISTIPGYATDAAGVKLSGVRGGGT